MPLKNKIRKYFEIILILATLYFLEMLNVEYILHLNLKILEHPFKPLHVLEENLCSSRHYLFSNLLYLYSYWFMYSFEIWLNYETLDWSFLFSSKFSLSSDIYKCFVYSKCLVFRKYFYFLNGCLFLFSLSFYFLFYSKKLKVLVI